MRGEKRPVAKSINLPAPKQAQKKPPREDSLSGFVSSLKTAAYSISNLFLLPSTPKPSKKAEPRSSRVDASGTRMM